MNRNLHPTPAPASGLAPAPGPTAFLVDDRYRLGRHLLLQAVILLISVSIFFDAPDRWNTSLNRFYGWIGYYLFMNMLVYVNAYLLFPRFLARSRVWAYAAATALFTLFALGVMVVLQTLFYDIAVTRQQPSTVAVFLSIASSMWAIFLFLGGISALLLWKRFLAANRRIDRLRLATFHSELGFLKSQINPHFLFNMINNAHILVEEDAAAAAGILLKLDHLLRYQLHDSLQEKVSLKADIDFLADYLKLEKIRRDQFDYTIEAKGAIDRIEVPPLLFIPFIENAVKHNAGGPASFVHVRFEAAGGALIFTCENSKPPRPVRREAGGLGLKNIRRRLDLLFDNDYVWEVRETDTAYTVYLQIRL